MDLVLRYLRLRGEVPELSDNLIVFHRFDRYQGLLSLATLLTSDPDASVAELMDASVAGIPASTTDDVVARLFEDRDLVSAPVVDEAGKLRGRITIDNEVDVIREEADNSLMSMAGLDEENDIFAPAVLSARRRGLVPEHRHRLDYCGSSDDQPGVCGTGGIQYSTCATTPGY